MDTQRILKTLHPAADFAGALVHHVNMIQNHTPVKDHNDPTYHIALRAYDMAERYAARPSLHPHLRDRPIRDLLHLALGLYVNAATDQHDAGGDEPAFNSDHMKELSMLLIVEYVGTREEISDHTNMAESVMMIMLWLFSANRGIEVLQQTYTTASTVFPDLVRTLHVEDTTYRLIRRVAVTAFLIQSTQRAALAVRDDALFDLREPLIVDALLQHLQDVSAFQNIVDIVHSATPTEVGG